MIQKVFINNIPIVAAMESYVKTLSLEAMTEVVPLTEALGRVTTRPVLARMSSPSDFCAAMDGIIVSATDTYEANEQNPVTLRRGEDFEYINTGNLLFEGRDSVIMIEDVIMLEEDRVQIITPAYPWQHIRSVGEDIVVGEMILPSKHLIRPLDFGALMNGGIEHLEVFKKPNIGILPTGSELVESPGQMKPGKIIDSNSRVFEALILEAGAQPIRYKPVADEEEALKQAILKGVEENEMLLINAGSSAGRKDFTFKLIEALGEVVIHGVALKPGKPTILGKIAGKPVIGIPGYPVSSYIVFETFVRPLLEQLTQRSQAASTVEATLSTRVVSSLKHEEVVRMTLGYVDDKWIATPLSRGAGATLSLVKADGLLHIPRLVEGVEAGEIVTIELMKPLSEISKRLIFIGSHDPIVDWISDQLPISSAHVGSFGGILAMKKGQCHVAPIHLLDEDTGTYNTAVVRQYFKEEQVTLIRGLKRLQGLMVQKGNPKNITSFKDLARQDVSFVNRQRGAGTRQLLDYHLKKEGIESHFISGYVREMNTHMAVAVTIASHGADVGLGVYSAACALGLQFIPICYEHYDFLVSSGILKDVRLNDFIKHLQSDAFSKLVNDLGGYELKDIGTLVSIDGQEV